MAIKTVGVVGCGLMGSGIAQVCAQSGYQTVVSEINKELLDRGIGMINASLSKAVERGKLTEEARSTVLNRLKGTVSLEDFRECDLVIEAVLEDMNEKRRVFSTLDKICPPHTIFSSNTSCLSVLEMAVSTKRPQKVLGLHFFNPVPVMKLVEIVRTIITDDDTLNTAKQFSESLGKKNIIAKDQPGFIVNRLLTPYLLDAMRLLESAGATREDIDDGMVLGCNHPMGPLALSDFIGLDTVNFIANAMYEEFKDPKYAAPTILRKMVAAGYLGRKKGKGFYDYK
ncbi:MAG: 3-hydroxybutyryl-CoA dehydrogenase [Dehalococcoidia bacterium]|nr:3-hydroxybutyryl-CoA dehydrogenase [Dehalococcoidia bacterium]